jgi:hypothetical protein
MTPKQQRAAKLTGAGIVAAGVVAATLLQPSGPVVVHPGDDVAKAARGLKSGGILTLSGAFKGPLTLDRLENETVNVAGSVSGGPVALKFTHFRNLVLNGGQFSEAGYGVMLQDGSGATVNGSRALNNQISGFLVANSDHVTFKGAEGSGSKTQWGFYGSQSSDHLAWLDCAANGNARGAVQVNANDPRRASDPLHDGISEDVTISGSHFDSDQSAGGAVITLAGVHGAKITDCAITNAKGRSLFVLWDDGAGKPFACQDVRIDRITGSFAGGRGKALISVKYTDPKRLQVGMVTVPGWKGAVTEWQGG